MTTNNTINVGLMTIFGLLVAGVPEAFATNFWYGIADVVAILVTATVYEVLP